MFLALSALPYYDLTGSRRASVVARSPLCVTLGGTSALNRPATHTPHPRVAVDATRHPRRNPRDTHTYTHAYPTSRFPPKSKSSSVYSRAGKSATQEPVTHAEVCAEPSRFGGRFGRMAFHERAYPDASPAGARNHANFTELLTIVAYSLDVELRLCREVNRIGTRGAMLLIPCEPDEFGVRRVFEIHSVAISRIVSRALTVVTLTKRWIRVNILLGISINLFYYFLLTHSAIIFGGNISGNIIWLHIFIISTSSIFTASACFPRRNKISVKNKFPSKWNIT